MGVQGGAEGAGECVGQVCTLGWVRRHARPFVQRFRGRWCLTTKNGPISRSHDVVIHQTLSTGCVIAAAFSFIRVLEMPPGHRRFWRSTEGVGAAPHFLFQLSLHG